MQFLIVASRLVLLGAGIVATATIIAHGLEFAGRAVKYLGERPRKRS